MHGLEPPAPMSEPPDAESAEIAPPKRQRRRGGQVRGRGGPPAEGAKHLGFGAGMLGLAALGPDPGLLGLESTV
jgi:hypothetical protein